MDTRCKLLTLDQAAALPAPALLVTGYFDPLLLAHAEQLTRVAATGELWALIGEPPSPLLPQRARAELVASLASVHRVIELGNLPLAEAAARFPGIPVCSFEQSDLIQRDALLVHIRQRHAAAASQ